MFIVPPLTVTDFNARNTILIDKLLQQGFQYHTLLQTFSKFYRRHYELVSKFNVGLKSFLQQGLLEPEFSYDFVYKLRKIVGRTDFSDQFRNSIILMVVLFHTLEISRCHNKLFLSSPHL